MHRTVSFAMLFLVASLCGRAQSVAFYTDTVYGCPGDTIEITLNTTGFVDIGSMTLFVNYSSQELTYDTCYSLNPMLPNMLVNHYLMPNPTIGFSWFTPNMNPVTIGTGTIARLRFVLVNDSALISFSPQCEVTSETGAPLLAHFVAAPIAPFIIPVAQQPKNVVVAMPGNASFTLIPDQVQVAVQWQKSLNQTNWLDLQDDAVHNGTQTNTLEINVTHDSLFSYFYRSAYQFGNCIGYSDHIWLIKDTSQNIYTIKNEDLTQLLPYPNPAVDNITIPLHRDGFKNITFALMDMTGKHLLSRNASVDSSVDSLHANLTDIPSGIYIAIVTYHYPHRAQIVQKYIITKK